MSCYCVATRSGDFFRVRFVKPDYYGSLTYNPINVKYDSIFHKKLATLAVTDLLNGYVGIIRDDKVNDLKMKSNFSFLSDDDQEYVTTYFVCVNTT